MKRFAVILAATGLALVTAAPAHAASGTLLLNGRAITDPHGCYDSEERPLRIENGTNETVVVHGLPGCSGRIVGFVHSGETAVVPGSSVSLP
ncbi:hypothetical protein [Marinitenerispora sediminis]|uniref:Uncharacterized protein n=1 Tax=Marinitenerispora sediminis TaxID=1931232 RepID=A0A368T884_9ACTN|nr:hypothetical protein [Marinitenerispora sediminis]RCV50014.1 hypothetical protein DEF28_19205 [Marinitenerispora sediminis]RCV54062.1 hypothetical protein DEF23_16565 [Marinitenerispora sediminis]RCV58559.1 hypothetical protein DEF24_13150 [Marinitenerispora sediminis]